MPTEKPRIILVFVEDLLQRIEDYRYKNRSVPTGNATFRKLIEIGLEHGEKETK